MKIKLLIALLLFIIAIPILYSAYPVERAKAEKKKVSEESIKFLADIGLTSSKTVTDNVDLIDYTLKKNYLKEFGVRYFSKTGLTTLMKAQGLVMGELSNYKGEIPEINIIEFKANYERLKVKEEYTHFYVDYEGKVIEYIAENSIKPEMVDGIINNSWGNYCFIVLKNNLHGQFKKVSYTAEPHALHSIKIVAPEKYFDMSGKEVSDDNKIIPKKVDPLILMEHEGGYLVLTSWFN